MAPAPFLGIEEAACYFAGCMHTFTKELEAACLIAKEAAALVRQYAGQTIKVEHKDGNEPVTEADRRASELIVSRLRAAFPDDAILSEEMADDGSRLHKERVWMVDPIDGTKDFIRGDEGYAVMIGLAVAALPKVGVVAQPATGKVYGAVVGGEAWLEREGRRQPLQASQLDRLQGVRFVASKSHRTPQIEAVRQRLGIVDEMNIGGVGLKVGLIAENVRDLYIYPGTRSKLWDACAPEAILHAVGGKMTDLYGQPLVYDTPELWNMKGLVASNGPLHDTVIEALALALQGLTIE